MFGYNLFYWKYCSKIIFKCMKNYCSLFFYCSYAWTVHRALVLKKKKKKKAENAHFTTNVNVDVLSKLGLIFVLFGSMFQDFPSLTDTKISLYFHSHFSLLLFYIHMSIAFHTIPSQIRLDKKRRHLLSTFQWHLNNSNVVVSFDRNPYE